MTGAEDGRGVPATGVDDLDLVLPFPADAAAEIETGQRLSLQQLAAVKSLLSVEAQATRHDILITTAFEALALAATTEQDLVAFCGRIWPGAGIDAARVNAAMRVAEHAGYVTRESVGGEPIWALAPTTLREVLTAKDWAKEVFDSTTEQVRAKLEEAGRVVSPTEARLWTASLQRGLMAAARDLLAPYEGDVVKRGPFGLVARHWDHNALRRALMESAGSSDDADLLIALAIDAIDPNTPFGNELLTCITTGYMLHAIMGGRDRVSDRQVLGALNGDRAILDTPVLLQLLGGARQAQPIERVISAAINAGMEVVALDHYLQEVRELIVAIETETPDVTGYLHGRDDAQARVARSVIGDDVVSMWLAAVEEGRYKDWADFRAAAARLDESLTALKVVVRSANNTNRDDVDSFERALVREMASRPMSRPRKPAATRRDADTMAMAHRTRERKEYLRAFFPGAWMITPDSHVGPAYKQMTGDELPLAITPMTWLAIICNCAKPVEAEELARAAAASLFGEETFMTVAGRFPARTAIKLALTLGPANGGSSLDMRIAQMSLDELLRNNATLEDGANEVTSKVVNEVMRKRIERLNMGYEEADARSKAQVERMAAAFRNERMQADAAEADQRAAYVISARNQDAETGRIRLLGDRQAKSYAVLAALLVTAAFLGFMRMFTAACLDFVSLIVFWKASNEWVSSPEKRWTKLLPTGLLDVLALLSALLHWPF